MAHFLIDASLPKPAAQQIIAHGHSATDVRDIGLGAAKDAEIAAHAKDNGLIVLTADLDFANIVDYPPADYAGIAVIRAPDKAGRAIVLGLIDQLLRTPDVVANLPGRLAIVELTRIRLRPRV